MTYQLVATTGNYIPTWNFLPMMIQPPPALASEKQTLRVETLEVRVENLARWLDFLTDRP